MKFLNLKMFAMVLGAVSMLSICNTLISPTMAEAGFKLDYKQITKMKKTIDKAQTNNRAKQQHYSSNTFRGHRYEIFNNCQTYEQAMRFCKSKGGYLASIDSKAENDFLYNFMLSRGYKSAYFGLYDYYQNGNWQNANGRHVAYMNWHRGEPNRENRQEKYAMFYWKFTDGTWNDGDFGYRTNNGGTAFICEWDE